MDHKFKQGLVVEKLLLKSIYSIDMEIPDPQALVHLQFRRFAGCPVCDLHLHSFAQRRAELVAASIREVIVFHSSRAELLKFCSDLPFDVIADPRKHLYAQFGIGSNFRALLAPDVWIPILRGVCRSFGRTLRGRAPLPSLNPYGGRFGLPADFLIAPNGVVLACKYGSHAFDQWSVDDVLHLARPAAPTSH